MSDDNVVNNDSFEKKRLLNLVHGLFYEEKEALENQIKILTKDFRVRISGKMQDYVVSLMSEGVISERIGNDYLRYCKENPLS